MRSQGNYIVSATKAIIETHVATNNYYNYYERITEKTTTRSHHTTVTMSKLSMILMNYQKAGLH